MADLDTTETSEVTLAGLNGINKLAINADGTININGTVTPRDIRYDPNNEKPDYIGINETKGAATSSTDWILYKYFYSGNKVTQIQRVTDSWDNRASAF